MAVGVHVWPNGDLMATEGVCVCDSIQRLFVRV